LTFKEFFSYVVRVPDVKFVTIICSSSALKDNALNVKTIETKDTLIAFRTLLLREPCPFLNV
jgi:hypothetical protein